MIKMTVFYRPPDDADAFEKKYREEHLPMVRGYANIQKVAAYKVTRTLQGDFPYAYVFSGTWADKDAWKADMNSEAAADPAVRCLLITGNGRGFSAGADLTQLEDSYRRGEPVPLGDMLRDGYNNIILPIVHMEKPVVAAINGVAAGAGCSMALACDFRIASDKARFFQAFIKVGLVQDSGASYFLPRLVGFAKAMELALLGEIIDANTALRYGLLTKVV